MDTYQGPGIVGPTLLWGIVTQCLQWGGVISWPWFAIWLPFLVSLVVWLILIAVAVFTIYRHTGRWK